MSRGGGLAVDARSRRSPRGRVVRWVSAVTAVVLVGGAIGAYLKFRSVWESIHRVAVTGLGHRPPKLSNAVNILVVGSSSRAGLTRHQQLALHVGRDPGLQSDTVMVVHLSPGGRRAVVLSFPRDLQVPVYGCPARGRGMPGQQADLAVSERINTPFAYGGPLCLWKTVEQQTGIHLDHFIELNFTGFVKVINDLGGVTVCLPFAVRDPTSGLRLRAGRHQIRGIQALAFWRTREGLGENSDLQRIQRDQFLMASLVQGIEHNGLLSSPARMLSVISDAASTLTTDAGLSQTELLRIGQSLSDLSGKGVQFITVPNFPDPANPNVVDFTRPQAGQLFAAIARDKKPPKPARPADRARRAHKAGTAAARTARPATVSLRVLNGTGTAGAAARAAASLIRRGFHVTGTGNASSFAYVRPVIEYSSFASRPGVATLRAQLTGPKIVHDPKLRPGTIELIIGSSYAGLRPGGASHSRAALPAGLARTYHGISGSTRVCRDQAAFTGPDSPTG